MRKLCKILCMVVALILLTMPLFSRADSPKKLLEMYGREPVYKVYWLTNDGSYLTERALTTRATHITEDGGPYLPIVREGHYYAYILDNEAHFFAYTGNRYDNASIPAYISGYPVRSIKAMSPVPSVVMIPETVVSIHPLALHSAYNTMVSVHPDNVVYADIDGVLMERQTKTLVYYPEGRKASSYAVPDGVQIIGRFAFSKNFSLQEVTFPQGLHTISSGAFHYCMRLMSISFPNSLRVIGALAFSDCGSQYYSMGKTVQIVLPEGLEVLSHFAFDSFAMLKSVTLPLSLNTIGFNPFSRCPRLAEINVSERHNHLFLTNSTLYDKTNERMVTYIGQQKLSEKSTRPGTKQIDSENFNNSNIESMVFLEGMEAILSNVLMGDDYINSVTLPSSLQFIGDKFMYNCDRVKEVRVPPGVVYIGEGSFLLCDNLTLLVDRDSYAHQYAQNNNLPYKFFGESIWTN